MKYFTLITFLFYSLLGYGNEDCCANYGNKFEIDANISQSSSVMADTVHLRLEGGSFMRNEPVCISLYAENFNEILGFQWGFQWDNSILEFDYINPNQKLTNTAITQPVNIIDRFVSLWVFTTESVNIEANVPIMDICFTAIATTEVPTKIEFDQSLAPIEITSELDLSAPVPTTFQNTVVEIGNDLDCGLLLTCQQQYEFTFEPGMVIHKADIIEQMNIVLPCQGYNIDEIRLINLSHSGAVPADSIIMTCDNVYQPTSIGVVQWVEQNSSAYQICNATVEFNIPDIYENCTNVNRSCLDPLTCQSDSIIITDSQTKVYYDQFVPGQLTTLCDMQFTSNFESDAAIPDEFPEGFILSCNNYEPNLNVNIGLISNQFAFRYFASDWCRVNLLLDSIDDACVTEIGDIPVSISNGIANLALNDSPLSSVNSSYFVLENEDIVEGENILSLLPSTVGPNVGLTTLDMVMAFQAIVDPNMPKLHGIAGDVDQSGSLTTIDIGRMRMNILGLTFENLVRPFIIEKNEDLSMMDYFNFDNDFEQFVFQRSMLSSTPEFVFEVFHYGDITGTMSQYHKSNRTAREITIEDQLVHAGEEVSIPINIHSKKSNPIVGAAFDLKLISAEIVKIESNFAGDVIQYNATDERTRVQFFSPYNTKDVELSLIIKLQKTMKISSAVSMVQSEINEVIYSDMEVEIPALKFQPTQQNATIDVFPNPVNDLIYIKVPQTAIGSTIELYNSLGQVVFQSQSKEEISKINCHGNYPSGLYYVHVFDAYTHSSYPIVIE